MSYLGLALFAEGPGDHLLLTPILHRLTDDLCLRHGLTVIEVGEVVELHSPHGHKDADRAMRILEVAREAQGAFHVLFIHTDGGGDAQAAFLERVKPAMDRMQRDLANKNRPVPVVPVRESEAWALADGEQLRAVFGTILTDNDLGVPSHARDVEKIADPKQTLELAYRRVTGQRRRKSTAANFLNAIGQQVSLDCLRKVPAFKQLETDLRSILVDIGYLNRDGD